jgi:hypothetical protein
MDKGGVEEGTEHWKTCKHIFYNRRNSRVQKESCRRIGLVSRFHGVWSMPREAVRQYHGYEIWNGAFISERDSPIANQDTKRESVNRPVTLMLCFHPGVRCFRPALNIPSPLSLPGRSVSPNCQGHRVKMWLKGQQMKLPSAMDRTG